mmetsp:Transcript_65761/g.104109  ORF Transcript_65761/g.104109 Transcript_65761/m.104109 type:complete len:278 (+) Transcript_65761:61-894(+)|eukprot:CAMPEP_0169240320 /NCGR_PEP_ID=MMETSP1016-20121227/31395_1 /TAXON_ID=342587 /ORGANISM="Karlodinium micrum, Strain CCMP2283" /LENGTH=277 /DNA_ID=CAMNT_0009320339 /DNA_START=44 /DNA_END=877 /DNA_ORIENTATION=+
MGGASCAGVERMPCFACCGYEEERCNQQRVPLPFRTSKTPSLTVEVASSPLAGLKGAAGYHTSVILSGEEFVFTPMGVFHYDSIVSHRRNPEMQLHYVGLTRYTGLDLLDCLDQHFPPDHYDLLRKNCNSFSDCALYFLCEQRLDPRFRKMERLGKFADDHVGLLQSISGGEYYPNPYAINFDVEKVITEIDAERETCDGGSFVADLDSLESERNALGQSVAPTSDCNHAAACNVAEQPSEDPKVNGMDSSRYSFCGMAKEVKKNEVSEIVVSSNVW